MHIKITVRVKNRIYVFSLIVTKKRLGAYAPRRLNFIYPSIIFFAQAAMTCAVPSIPRVEELIAIS